MSNGVASSSASASSSKAPPPTPSSAPEAPLRPLYHESSQFRHWRYSKEQLTKMRKDLNERAVSVVRSNIKAEKVRHHLLTFRPPLLSLCSRLILPATHILRKHNPSGLPSTVRQPQQTAPPLPLRPRSSTSPSTTSYPSSPTTSRSFPRQQQDWASQKMRKQPPSSISSVSISSTHAWTITREASCSCRRSRVSPR